MANENLTTAQELMAANERRDDALNDNTTLWAIARLGSLLSDAQDDMGYDSLTRHHWSAIGVAINRMATNLCEKQGKWCNQLDDEAGEIAARHEAKEAELSVAS